MSHTGITQSIRSVFKMKHPAPFNYVTIGEAEKSSEKYQKIRQERSWRGVQLYGGWKKSHLADVMERFPVESRHKSFSVHTFLS